MGFKAAFGGFMAAAREDRLLNEEREEEEKIREENRRFQTELADKQHERALERMALQHQNALKLQGASRYNAQALKDKQHNQRVKGVALRLGVDPANKEEMAKISSALYSYSDPNEFIDAYREGYIRDKMSDPGLTPDQQMADAMPPHMAGDQDPNRGITVEQDKLGLQFGQDPYATLPNDVGRMSSRQIKQWIDVNNENAKPNDVAYMQQAYETQLELERNAPVKVLEENLAGIDKLTEIPAFETLVNGQYDKGKIDVSTRDRLLKEAQTRRTALGNINAMGDEMILFERNEYGEVVNKGRVHKRVASDNRQVWVLEGTNQEVDVSQGTLVSEREARDWKKTADANVLEATQLGQNHALTLSKGSELITMVLDGVDQGQDVFNQYTTTIGNVSNHIKKIIDTARIVGVTGADGAVNFTPARQALMQEFKTADDRLRMFNAAFIDLVLAQATKDGETGLGRMSDRDVQMIFDQYGGGASDGMNFVDILRRQLQTDTRVVNTKLQSFQKTHGGHFTPSGVYDYTYPDAQGYLEEVLPQDADYIWSNVYDTDALQVEVDDVQDTEAEATSNQTSNLAVLDTIEKVDAYANRPEVLDAAIGPINSMIKAGLGFKEIREKLVANFMRQDIPRQSAMRLAQILYNKAIETK